VGPRALSGCFGEERNLLSLPGSELQFLRCLPCSLVTVLTLSYRYTTSDRQGTRDMKMCTKHGHRKCNLWEVCLIIAERHHFHSCICWVNVRAPFFPATSVTGTQSKVGDMLSSFFESVTSSAYYAPAFLQVNL
jgi:hypothetical protein